MVEPLPNEPVLALDAVSKTYAESDGPVVHGLSLELQRGEILAVLGPSGCGKTTTLRLIAGFERADEGRILLGCQPVEDAASGKHVPPQSRGIGFVFQDYALFPHLDVLANVAFGLKSLPRKMRTRVAQQALDRVGLRGYERRKPHELSGGQQQRVALARSFAPRPKVMLLDEPFSNFDAALRADARSQVREILKATGTSAILVTHDQEEALTVADRIAVMNEGCIEQIGDPVSVYRKPATAFVAQFLGSTNLLPATGSGLRAECELGSLDVATEAHGEVLLSVRPEQFTISANGGGDYRGVIESRQFKGHDQIYRVRLGEQTVYVMTDHKTDIEPGAEVGVTLSEPAVVLRG